MTIKDIARESGCAVGTVSRVLNNQEHTSEATRQKVMEVVNRYGFVINKNAKNLKEQRSKTIVVFVSGIDNIFLSGILEKIHQSLESLPYATNVMILNEDDDLTKKALEVYHEQKPLGMIFLGGNPEKSAEEFARIKIPSVLISTQAETSGNPFLSSVGVDDTMSSYAAANFLIENGHKKIGVIGGDIKKSEMSLRRYTGFIEAIDSAGLEFDYDSAYITVKYSIEEGYRSAEELLKRRPDLTAVFTMADVLAIGACRKFFSMGLKVPDDISVIGFDGIQMAEFYNPRITTIKQLVSGFASIGIDALVNQIENNAPPVHELIPFELVKGESVKNINKPSRSVYLKGE